MLFEHQFGNSSSTQSHTLRARSHAPTKTNWWKGGDLNDRATCPEEAWDSSSKPCWTMMALRCKSSRKVTKWMLWVAREHRSWLRVCFWLKSIDHNSLLSHALRTQQRHITACFLTHYLRSKGNTAKACKCFMQIQPQPAIWQQILLALLY